jgi:hypothetical protein
MGIGALAFQDSCEVILEMIFEVRGGEIHRGAPCDREKQTAHHAGEPAFCIGTAKFVTPKLRREDQSDHDEPRDSATNDPGEPVFFQAAPGQRGGIPLRADEA